MVTFLAPKVRGCPHRKCRFANFFRTAILQNNHWLRKVHHQLFLKADGEPIIVFFKYK